MSLASLFAWPALHSSQYIFVPALRNVGFILMGDFAVKLNWFPAIGYTAPTENIAKYFYHMALPVLATGLVVMALIGRMTRATRLEVLSEDYISTARSKGQAETRVSALGWIVFVVGCE